MKNLISKAAIAAMLTAVSCSVVEEPVEKNEIPQGEGVALRVATGVKTGTKAVVDGKTITYIADDYATAPGVGLVLLNKVGTAFYAAENTSDYANGASVWFMGDENGVNWKAISSKEANFAGATAKPYYLTDQVARVYAWYPYTAATIFSTGTEAGLTVDASITSDNKTINASAANNAGVIWDVDASPSAAWVENTEADQKKILATTEEVDYLYFDGGVSTGSVSRYVNNGKGIGATSGMNTDATNPGSNITLEMKHAMAMISFRVYCDESLTSARALTKIEVESLDNDALKLSGSPKMALADGKISGNTYIATNKTIIRTISNYTVPMQIAAGGTENADSFIENAAATPAVTGKTVARKVSMIVYPMTFALGDIGLKVTIDGSTYTTKIPGTTWTAGNNIVYTIRSSHQKLTVVDVKVTEWNEVDGGLIDI